MYASVVNKTYFDVPICDKYSNIDYSNTTPKTKYFNTINQQIGRRVNKGNDFYYVDSIPDIPSQSLYKESDNDYSLYYEKMVNSVVENFSVEQKFAETTLTFCFIAIFFILIILSYYFTNSYFFQKNNNNR
jgi:hypothetical protein